jgi:hypothetical protein
MQSEAIDVRPTRLLVGCQANSATPASSDEASATAKIRCPQRGQNWTLIDNYLFAFRECPSVKAVFAGRSAGKIAVCPEMASN